MVSLYGHAWCLLYLTSCPLISTGWPVSRAVARILAILEPGDKSKSAFAGETFTPKTFFKLLYVHRDRTGYKGMGPRTSTSTFTQLLSFDTKDLACSNGRRCSLQYWKRMYPTLLEEDRTCSTGRERGCSPHYWKKMWPIVLEVDRAYIITKGISLQYWNRI